MAKKDMLMVALGKNKPIEDDEDDGLEYGADDEGEEMDEESVDPQSAVIDDLVDAGFSEDKASALVDAILALKA